jgi:hypothetical protein
MEIINKFVDGMPWYGWVPIVGMVTGGVVSIVLGSLKHAERMERLRQGLDPDRDGDS